MIIEARGRKVIVRDGPQTKTHTLEDAEAALTFAAKLEDERLERMKHDVAMLARYADPNHPADPVLPRPGELLRRLAEIYNGDHPDAEIELPSPSDDTSDEDVLRARTLALLSKVRTGAPIEFGTDLVDPDSDEADDEPEESEETEVEPDVPAVNPVSGETPEPVPLVDVLRDELETEPETPEAVTFAFDHDSRGGRLKVVLTSVTSEDVALDRVVTDEFGVEVRSGKSKLPAGRVMTRHYDLGPGQTIVFARAGVVLGSYSVENTTDPEPTE